MPTKETRFNDLQRRWQEADTKWQDFNYELRRQYGDQRGYCWNVPKGKRARQERLEAAEARAMDRFMRFLETLNPDRQWSSGFPVGFLRASLTYADAVTRDRMSVTPPAAYGYTTRDAEAFSGPLA